MLVVAVFSAQALFANPMYRFANDTNHKVKVWADFMDAHGTGDWQATYVEGKCNNFGWTKIEKKSHVDSTRNHADTKCSLLNQVQFKVFISKGGDPIIVKTDEKFYLNAKLKDLFYTTNSGSREGKAQITLKQVGASFFIEVSPIQ